MPTLPPTYSPFRAARESGLLKPSPKQVDERRGSAHRRGYGVAWQRQREADLAAQPLCIAHKANGHVKAARVVDHIIPHRGDKRLFWEPRNRQNLCDNCHNEIKKIIEARWEAGLATEADLRLDRPLPEFFDTPQGGSKIL